MRNLLRMRSRSELFPLAQVHSTPWFLFAPATLFTCRLDPVIMEYGSYDVRDVATWSPCVVESRGCFEEQILQANMIT